MFRRFAAIAVLLFLPLSVYGQDETVRKTIAELDPITSPQLLLDDNILFGVDILGTPNDSRHLTLTQLKNRGHVIAVNVIADMPSLLVSDGQLVATRGRIALGDGGARLYRYSATATASADGVYIVNGPSGTGRFIELASEKADLAASGIGNDAAIKFAVEDEGTSTPYSIALSEILKRSAVTSVATIADLATLAPKNGQIVITRGQATVGDGGGRIYRYDLTSNATADGVYKVLGPSSVGRYIEIASERTNIASSAIANNSAIKFYVEDTTNRQIRGYTLAELLLKTAGGGGGGSVDVPVLTSDTIAGMSALAPSDGDVVITLGGAAKGDGGSRVYRYDLAATAISNGTSIVDGPGGNGRYIDIESERTAITSESIADNSTVKLVVHNSVTNARSTYTLAELLEKTGVPGGDRQPFLAVNRIADLAGLSPQNGDIVVTRGQVTAGDGGARMYRYDSGSSAVADGIYIVTGPGGTGRYLELIQERQALTAAAIANNALVEFNVQNKSDNTPRRMTLAELITKTNAAVDHGAITGLADDDHPQYHNDARGDARYYTQAQVDASLANKADALHSHVIGNVTGLQTALDNRLIVGNNLSDLQNAETARANLGLEIGTDVQAQLTAASQAEMEAGTEVALRTMSPLRVAQAIAALGEASQVKVVDDVAAMKALTGLANGNIVMTLSYDSTHPGAGANVYRYTTGSGTEDGGFFFTATGMGSGGFEALDQTVADVTQFGAVPGGADCSARVKAALQSGAEVWFPKGAYDLSSWASDVTVSAALTIKGAGESLVTITGPGRSSGTLLTLANGAALHIEGIKTSAFNYVLRSTPASPATMSVQVKDSTFAAGYQHISTDNNARGTVLLDGVTFTDFDDSAMRWLNVTATHIDIHDCDIGGATSLLAGGLWGIILGTDGDLTSEGIVIRGCDFHDMEVQGANTSIGLMIFGGDATISGSTFRDFVCPTGAQQTGLYCKGRDIAIAANVFNSVGGDTASGGCVTVKNTSDTGNITITGNTFSIETDVNQAILFEGTGLVASGNIVRCNGGSVISGAIVMQNVTDSVLVGNSFNNLSSDVSTFGFNLTSCDRIVISGNNCQGITTSSSGICGFVKIQGSTSSDIKVIGNTVNETAAITSQIVGVYDESSWETGKYLTVENNTFTGINCGVYRPSSVNVLNLVMRGNTHSGVSQTSFVHTCYLVGALGRVVYDGNTSTGLTSSDNNAVAGVYLNPSSATSIQITNNIIDGLTTSSGSKYGIRVNATGTVPLLVLDNNIIKDTATHIYLQGTYTAGSMKGNRGYSASGAAFYYIGTTLGAGVQIMDNWDDDVLTDNIAIIRHGSGSPEGVVTAPIGSLFLRVDGGASTSVYVKESGTGNTGWVAK